MINSIVEDPFHSMEADAIYCKKITRNFFSYFAWNHGELVDCTALYGSLFVSLLMDCSERLGGCSGLLNKARSTTTGNWPRGGCDNIQRSIRVTDASLTYSL